MAIIGLGPAGLAALLGIVREARRPLSILVVDPSDQPGGDAYRRARPEHLLNARAASMSVDPHDPASFSRWLGRRLGHSPEQAADCYAPRPLYGDYLDDMRLLAISLANESGHLLYRLRQPAVDIVDTANGWEVRLARGDARLARHVIIATGCVARADWKSGCGPRVASNPWELDYEEAARLHGSGTAVVAGGGLSGIDAILSLATAGWTGPIVLASARGTLPARHSAAPAAAVALPPAPLTAASAPALFREIRRALQADILEGRDWRARFQQLREELPALWPRLAPATRRRLLRHAVHLWNQHRHRMAPTAASHLDDLMRRGQLRVEPWRVAAVTQGPDRLAIEVHDRHGRRETLAADLFIAACGLDLAADSDPLLARLLDRGIVARSATGLGLAVEAVGTAVSRRARGSSLHVLGAKLVGERLESTAVLELVGQARLAARELSACLGRSSLAGAAACSVEPLFATD